jgi:hypothetical protein
MYMQNIKYIKIFNIIAPNSLYIRPKNSELLPLNLF